jgi:hypothetical protein
LKTFLKIKFKNLKKKKKKKKKKTPCLRQAGLGHFNLIAYFQVPTKTQQLFQAHTYQGFFFFFKTKENKKLSYINLRKNDNFIMPK